MLKGKTDFSWKYKLDFNHIVQFTFPEHATSVEALPACLPSGERVGVEKAGRTLEKQSEDEVSPEHKDGTVLT